MTDRSLAALLRKQGDRITSVERRLSRGTYRLPERLSQVGQEVTNWNDVNSVGFYWCENTATNAPFADRFVGEVYAVGGDGPLAGRLVQEVRVPSPGAIGQATWRRVFSGTWSAWVLLDSKMVGTAAQRVQMSPSPRYWDFWHETDTGLVMVGNKSGGWRRFSGSASSPVAPWDVSNAAALSAGRSVTFTLATVLEPDESLTVAMDPQISASSFSFIGSSYLVRNPTNTLVTIRLMQILNATTQQAFGIIWHITRP